MKHADILSALSGRLVVSCQPVPGGPLDEDDLVLRLALAAVAGGAAGLRIEGAPRVRVVAAGTQVPVIGITKRDLPDYPVRITPFVDDVEALADAGAHIIAMDATERPRPVALPELLAAAKRRGVLAMADCSSLDEGLVAARLGFDIIGTTLSGYTGGPVPGAPDLQLVHELAGRVPRVMAEGRYNTPEAARAAREAGAWAVTVGTAITRVEWVTGWFADQVAAAGQGTPTSASVGSEAKAP